MGWRALSSDPWRIDATTATRADNTPYKRQLGRPAKSQPQAGDGEELRVALADARKAAPGLVEASDGAERRIADGTGGQTACRLFGRARDDCCRADQGQEPDRPVGYDEIARVEERNQAKGRE